MRNDFYYTYLVSKKRAMKVSEIRATKTLLTGAIVSTAILGVLVKPLWVSTLLLFVLLALINKKK